MPIITNVAECDTLNPSYACLIKPIIKKNCYSCHSDQASQSGSIALDLENFDSFKTYLQLTFRNDGIYGSKFYNTILQTPLIIPMPPDSRLTDNELRLIKRWIDHGALYN